MASTIEGFRFIDTSASTMAEKKQLEPLILSAIEIIENLSKMLETNCIDTGEQKWLTSYGKLFNQSTSIPLEVEKTCAYNESESKTYFIPNVLSVNDLNNVDKEIRNLAIIRLILALKVLCGASTYTPRRVKINVNEFLVHNEWIQLKSGYSSNDFKETLKLLREKGVFNFHTDPDTGLVQTAETKNVMMLRQWFTDGSMNGMWQKDVDPENWYKVLLIHMAAIQHPIAQNAIKETVSNPGWYRIISEDPLQAKEDGQKGIPHIFNPNSVKFNPASGLPDMKNFEFDSFFNRKRVESTALILEDAIDCLEEIVQGNSLQESSSEKIINLIIKSSADLARYLIAINTDPETGSIDMKAPSGSSWEEAPFPEGMTSDIGLTVVAFHKLFHLLFSERKENKPILQVIRDKFANYDNSILCKDKITSVIEVGRKIISERIINRIFDNTGTPMQNPFREEDTSLLLLFARGELTYFLTEKPYDNAWICISICQQMKTKLMGTHGMRRYNVFKLHDTVLHDSYLNDSYCLPPSLRAALLNVKSIIDEKKVVKEHGSKDTSGLSELKERQELSRPEHAAEWCLGLSACLKILAKAKIDLLNHMIKNNSTRLIGNELELIAKINDEINYFTQFNLSTISGETLNGNTVIRADGTKSTGNNVMEAFVVNRDLLGNPVRVPGAHTLAWGASQLYDALKTARDAALLEENNPVYKP